MRPDDRAIDPLITGDSARQLLELALTSDEELATVVRDSDSARQLAVTTSGLAPGVVIARRFRITGLLARGGMGDVYRAEDLQLGQTVALKFLPSSRELDVEMVERFRDEVRLGRRIAHPNVCRIYDLLDVEGRPAIVMEFVEGEDLRSLLARAGRLSYRRALDLARDICAGVAAAHDRGVAHGDLKPANVMVDGDGRARITDFGLARVAGQRDQQGRITGTVAYMAPEQAAYGAIATGSDVYSLGLLLYELFTGSRARECHTLEQAAAAEGEIVPPSQLRPAIDAHVEQAILLSLRQDPRERPTARAVLSAFPAADPLSEMVASGETPSPEIVAAAELGTAPSQRLLVGWSLCILLGLAALLPLSATLTSYGRTALPMRPSELAARARTLAATLAWAQHDGVDVLWFEPNRQELGQRLGQPDDGGPLSDRPLPPIVAHYRTAPAPWRPVRPDGRIGADAPGLLQRREAHAILAPDGRLLALRSTPPADRSVAGVPPTSWQRVLAAAGAAGARRVSTTWIPSEPFDEIRAWTTGDLSIRGAMLHGRITELQVVRAGEPQVVEPASRAMPQLAYFVLLLATTAAGAVLAYRNFKARRVDRVAAWRVAFWVFVVRTLHVLLTGNHPLTLADEPAFLATTLGSSLLLAAEVWLGYAALEPSVRKRWPRVMVTWTRLVHGGWRDRFVGRAVLAGVMTGLLLRLLDHVRNALPRVLAVEVIPSELAVEAITSVRRTVGGILLYQSHAIFYALFGVFLLVLLKRVARWEWLAIAAWITAMMMIWTRWNDPRVDAPIVAAQMGLLLLTVYRAGLLGFTTAIYVQLLTVYTPLTHDVSAIYFAQSAVGTAAIVALAGAGIALAWGRPAAEGASSVSTV